MRPRLGYSVATAGIYDLEEAFAFAASLGLDFLELNYDTCDFLPQAQQAQKVNQLKEATGISVSVHLPFIDLNIASLIPAIHQASVEQTLKGLDYAHCIDATCAVLHTGKVFIYQPVSIQASYEALGLSLQTLSGSSVPVALENLALSLDGLVREPEMLKVLTQSYNMKNCLDFGHAFIESSQSWRKEIPGEDLIQKYINVLGNNITHLHLCNNDGQADLHDATDQGLIPLERYADYLSTFKGSICLEVAGGKDAIRRSVKHMQSLMSVSVA
jgi:sugar phosphate isomerase/epimerase